MEPFHVILLLVIDDMVQQSDYSLTGTFIVICTLALPTVLLSYVSFRFPKLRPAMEGEPLVLIRTARRSCATYAASA